VVENQLAMRLCRGRDDAQLLSVSLLILNADSP
jgi:hypothetical protein